MNPRPWAGPAALLLVLAALSASPAAAAAAADHLQARLDLPAAGDPDQILRAGELFRGLWPGRGLQAAAGKRSRPGNPFTGGAFYVNPDYAKAALASQARVKGSATSKRTRSKIATVAGMSTGVWLDRIAAIKGGSANSGRLGLTGHLDAALKQAAAAGKPAVVPIVVYDLPSRDCAALASNGELGPNDLPSYKSKYIDAIYKALTSKVAYAAVRVVAVVEPDSLPNMITNMGVPACAAVKGANAYVKGVTYAIQKLGKLPNVAIYLDIAHSGWLGWPNNMGPAVQLYAGLINAAEAGGAARIRGLATDIANYTPLLEPFLSASNQNTLSSSFYQYNPMFDETSYVGNLSAMFTAAGVPGLGFVVDTSRSGWKPVNNGKPIDKRKARGNWCNVKGSGIGERPNASPRPALPMLDAFVWIKPPGESDGSSTLLEPGNVPNAQGKRFDPNCDPSNHALDAMSGAPEAGAWFHDMFVMLVSNAYPPLT